LGRIATTQGREDDVKVAIKNFDVEMEFKNNGVEFEVRKPDGELLGDCYITKTGLIWCQAKTTRKNGVMVKWQEFIDWMKSDDVDV
jgi:hypothetical protein